MSEPQRTEHAHAGPLSDADRDARIEQLLLSGLDQYFAGQFQQAINVWTRVAFLEQGEGRARAYIERARGAMAERQRESEELLHGGIAAYHVGDFDQAKALLARSVERDGATALALEFLRRLNRVEAATTTSFPLDAAENMRPAGAVGATPIQRGAWFRTAAASLIVSAMIFVVARPVTSWVADRPVSAAPAATVSPADPLPMVRDSDRRLTHARDLYVGGRPRDALRVLAAIDPADPVLPQADRLRNDIQRAVLARIDQAAVPAPISTAVRPLAPTQGPVTAGESPTR